MVRCDAVTNQPERRGQAFQNVDGYVRQQAEQVVRQITTRRATTDDGDVSHLRNIYSPIYSLVRYEFGQGSQAEIGVHLHILLQPAQMTSAVDYQDAITWRRDQLENIAVDANIAPVPVGQKVRAGVVAVLAKACRLHVEIVVRGDRSG